MDHDISPRFLKNPRNLELARYYRLQPFGRRSKSPAHDHEYAAAKIGDIDIGIFLPHLDGLQFEQPSLNGRSKNLQVARRFLG